MIGFIMLMINGYYKAFNGEGFVNDINALCVASVTEILVEIMLCAIFSLFKR